MSRPRRALTVGTAALACVGLAACGGSNTRTTTTVVTSPQTQTAATTTSAAAGASGVTGAGAGVAGTPGSASTGAVGTGPFAVTGFGGQPTATLIRPFSSDSPWNTPVDTSAPDPNSDLLIQRVQLRVGVEERGKVLRKVVRPITQGLFINTFKWTVPVVDEQGAVQTQVVCRQLPPYCGDGKDVSSLLIPSGVDPLPQYDGWYTVFDRRDGVAYDMWRARRGAGGNVISYQFMRKWSLTGPGFQQLNAVSARGSGLPLFAGLIDPEEIQAGRIEHALAISLPGPAQRNYVQPASSTDGVGDLNSLPEGARIRLKAGVRLSHLLPRTDVRAAQAIFTALRRYGAIVVDRSAVPTLYAKLNFDWSAPLRDPNGNLLDGFGLPLKATIARLTNQGTPLLRGNEVQSLHISDFEVVRLPPIHTFPPLKSTSSAPVAQSFTAVVP